MLLVMLCNFSFSPQGFCYGPYSKTAASAAGTTNKGVFSQEQEEPEHAGGALNLSFPTGRVVQSELTAAASAIA
jgi:hypothetical protein